ncbi:MAG: ethylbenzene dehydrogenase, partial [Actinobacteria bacterium ATB1]|nr:ethylbenzene dehydrogenase [Actinobacteria bacterium ATB1]
MTTTIRTPAAGIRAQEDRYRRLVEFDEVAWGSHCVDCYPGGCPYRVYVKGGRVIREEVAGSFLESDVDSHEPDVYPMGCNKGAAWSAQLEAPDRLRHPMRRVGERGSGEWERITWDEALDTVADALIDAIEESGSESIIREGTPEVGVGMGPDRLVGLLGGVVLDLNGSINDFSAGHHLTFGKFFPLFVGEGEFFDSDTIIFWHTNPTYTVIPWYHFYCEARYHGTELVLFSPDVSPSHLHVDYHVPVEWGSDPAVALAMCQVIVEEGLVDEDFVRTQTDLSLLVRTDTGRFLRESDLTPDGRDDQFHHLDPARGVVPASRENLLCDYAPALEGEISVGIHDGTEVRVTPLMTRLRALLEEYTPERVEAVAGTHPETLRMLARKIAAGRTRIIMGMGANKAYHSDLYQRTMNL